MIVQYDPEIYKRLKKVDVRIRKQFFEKIRIFEKNPNDPVLNNHPLEREYEGYRSIDITNDYRTLYQELDGSTIAYFSLLDTHKGLFG